MPGLDEVNAVVPVEDIMSTPVITALESDSIEAVAKLMDEHNVGSIVVVDDEGRPTGVITERDIVLRVATRSLSAIEVTAKSAMSSPLVTIELKADIKKAAAIMQRENVGRLVIMHKGEMVGIVSDRDIVAITPSLIEIITEKARITRGRLPLKDLSTTGYCERCRQWSTSLKEVDGSFICEECRIELGGEV